MTLPTPDQWLEIQRLATVSRSRPKGDLRVQFRNDCFKRDNYQCRMCGYKPDSKAFLDWPLPLDTHHIVDRSLMPSGGYVTANGISLCHDCHLWAEEYHALGVPLPGYSPSDLYAKIESNYEWAVLLSDALSPDDLIEVVVCREKVQIKKRELFGDKLDADSWELTCLELGETNSTILLYGKGRF